MIWAWWQRKWATVMTWAVAITAAGFTGPYLWPQDSPAFWHWWCGAGIAATLLAWMLEPARHRAGTVVLTEDQFREAVTRVISLAIEQGTLLPGPAAYRVPATPEEP